MNKKIVKKLSDQEKIRLMEEAYQKFLREIKKIEKDASKKLLNYIKQLEEMQIELVKKEK